MGDSIGANGTGKKKKNMELHPSRLQWSRNETQHELKLRLLYSSVDLILLCKDVFFRRLFSASYIGKFP
jgi:hypothetical protein